MVEGGVPFPMLSDAGGQIGELYGVYEAPAGVDIRGRFLIDPDFNIRAAEVLTPEVGRNPQELLRQVVEPYRQAEGRQGADGVALLLAHGGDADLQLGHTQGGEAAGDGELLVQ